MNIFRLKIVKHQYDWAIYAALKRADITTQSNSTVDDTHDQIGAELC